ncbi:transcriptional regulator [Flavobacterium qiangtangense]|uniref:Transcriptional regulator n=1 Tax=Flavobacterium qiangtangense TaxID=1442595 RepID=A0ABW1PRJ1_9FLAO
MKCILSLYFLLILSSTSFSQNFETTQIDSILRVVERLEKHDYPYGITLSLKTYDDSKKLDYKEGMLSSLLLASREQYELGKFEDAIKNASEAENIANYLIDFKSLSDALRLRGVSFTRLKNYKSGRIYLKRALISAGKLNDVQTKSSRIGVIYNDIAFSIDQNHGDLDSVAYFYRKGYREFEKMALNNSLKNKTLSLACSNVGSAFLRAKELDSAQYYLDRALQLANSVDHNVVIANTLNDLGSLYYLKKDYNSSIDRFQKGILIAKKIKNPYILASLYLGISKALKKANDNIGSSKFLSEYISLSDSLKNSGNLDNESKKLLEQEKIIVEPIRSTRSFIFILFLSLVFIGIIYLALGRSRKVKKVEVVDETIKNNANHVDENLLKRIVFLAKEDDPSFLGIFKEAYPGFYKKINEINPNLIAGEQKMCGLLKLDFTTKEIATCTNSSVRAVEAKKYRLRKKLSIASEEDINVWMMNI